MWGILITPVFGWVGIPLIPNLTISEGIYLAPKSKLWREDLSDSHCARR